MNVYELCPHCEQEVDVYKVIDLVRDYFNEFLGNDGYYRDYEFDVDVEDGNVIIVCAWIQGD